MKRALNQILNERKLFFPIIINSTIAYIGAFIITYVVYQVSTVVTAASCNISTKLMVNRIVFLTPDSSSLWSTDVAFLVFTVGPVVSLLFGLISLLIYMRLMNDKGAVKLLFLWTSVHFFSRVLSFFILGNIFFLYGPNLIIDWLYLGDGFRIVASAVAFMLMIAVGMALSGTFIHSANNINLVQMPKRLAFILSQVIIPYVFGGFFIFLYFLTGFRISEMVEVFIGLSTIFCLLPVIVNYQRFTVLHIEEPVIAYPVEKKFLIFAISFIILFRLVIFKGFTL